MSAKRCPQCGSDDPAKFNCVKETRLGIPGIDMACRDPWHTSEPGKQSRDYPWTLETMQIINKLTPDIHGKAFDPDWFLLRERLEQMEDRAGERPTGREDSHD